MSNEVEIVVTGDNRAKPALDSARQGVKGLGDDAKTSSKATDALGAALKDVGDKATATLSRSTVGFKSLSAEIDKTKKAVGDLRAKFAETGEIDLLGDIDKETAKLKKLEGQFKRTFDVDKETSKVKELEGQVKRVFDLVDHQSNKKRGGLLDFSLDEWAAKIAKAASGAVAGGLDSGLQSAGKAAAANPWIAAGIAAGITLGIPVIGGAVTAAVGGGVIAGGIMLAAKDPRVGSAWSAVGDSAKGKLTGAADVFVDPLVHGAKTFGDTLDRILPSIDRDFNRLAPVVDKLFSGAGGFVEKLMPGIDALTTQAGPTLTMVADELPRMGAAASTMMKAIASGGEGGKQALHDLLLLTEGLIVATGDGVAAFEKWYQAERAIVSVLTGDFDGAKKSWGDLIYGIGEATPVADTVAAAVKAVADSVGSVGPAAELTNDQLKELETQLNSVALTADVVAGQMADKMLNSMMSMDQSVLGFAESQTRLGDSIKQSGLELDIHTAKGQANREAILGSVQANVSQYDAMMRAGAGADEAAAAYDANTAALENQMRAAGFTQGEIDNLIGKYRGVPAEVNTSIAMKGLTDAIGSLDDAIRLANHLDGRHVNTYVTTHFDETGNTRPGGGGRYAFAAGGIVGAAGGGPRSNLVMVGEQGRELVRLPFGSTVIPHGQTERMAAADGADADGAGVGRISADAIGEAVARRIVPTLQELAQLANRPAVIRANGRELARTVREAERDLGYQQ